VTYVSFVFERGVSISQEVLSLAHGVVSFIEIIDLIFDEKRVWDLDSKFISLAALAPSGIPLGGCG
jgi:hypothetical protein